jgi:hypothetical protein
MASGLRSGRLKIQAEKRLGEHSDIDCLAALGSRGGWHVRSLRQS